jgi:prophage DNA circulation protein
MLRGVMASVPSGGHSEAARLRRKIGLLIASLEEELKAATLGTGLMDCFGDAAKLGASYVGMDKVRRDMLAVVPKSAVALDVATCGVRLAMAAMVRAIADTAYSSRQDVEAVMDTVNTAFEQAETYAADTMETDAYMALVAMHGACTRDLADRALPLPRVVRFVTAEPTPSLVLANIIYGDASRSDELVMENKAVHPAFMPVEGNALSE